RLLEGGAFVTPSLYRISSDHPVVGYLSEELFGPNIAIESFKDLDFAIARMNESPYGLSNSIFTLNPHNGDRLYHETKSGVLNINRSTNGAYGQMPFGGLKKSGNHRPAGIDAVRNATFPVAISALAFGHSPAPKTLKKLVEESNSSKTPLNIIVLRHRLETIFELYGINSDFAGGESLLFSCQSFAHLESNKEKFFAELKELFSCHLNINKEYLTFSLGQIKNPTSLITELMALLERYWVSGGLSLSKNEALKINVPKGLMLPRSRAMLDRLYYGHFVPEEKKALVADLQRSKGAYLVSVDEDPLILFDAASQIATLGAGFMADTWQNAYECGDLDLSIENTWDCAMEDDGSELAH
ncbi:MAG TPA: aldehyde dehydrogenase family protein, partial [Myxococcota bacterium]|nr:aldehyde dehydrogenase family protein [Myxococcota bacterium]